MIPKRMQRGIIVIRSNREILDSTIIISYSMVAIIFSPSVPVRIDISGDQIGVSPKAILADANKDAPS